MNDSGKKVAGGVLTFLLVLFGGLYVKDRDKPRTDTSATVASVPTPPPPPIPAPVDAGGGVATDGDVPPPPAPTVEPPVATEPRIEAAEAPEPPAKRIDTVDPLPPAQSVYVYTLTRPAGLEGLATVCMSFPEGPYRCVDFAEDQNEVKVKDTRPGALMRWAPRYASEPITIEVTATTP